MAIVGAVVARLRSRLEERLISKQIKDLEPEILARLVPLKPLRADIQAGGVQPFTWITVEVLVITSTQFEGGRPLKDATLPVVSLANVEVQPFAVAPHPGQPRTKRGVVTQDHIMPFQWSAAVPLLPEDVQEYLSLKQTLEWAEKILQEPHLPEQDRERIQEEFDRTTAQFRRWMEAS
jgi:hypothetical protein